MGIDFANFWEMYGSTIFKVLMLDLGARIPLRREGIFQRGNVTMRVVVGIWFLMYIW